MTPARIFVVEDDPDHLDSLCDLIAAVGHETVPFASGAEALAAARQDPPALVLTDLRMPGMDGIALLSALVEAGCSAPVVLLTGHGDVSHAVQAMQLGAEDFLEKPYAAEHLLSVIARGLKTGRLKAEVARLQNRLAEQGDFIGDSRPIAELRARLRELAPLEIDVVVTGETGTGKELAARLLHHRGKRAEGPFVVVNCATLPDSGAEQVLFGTVDRPGLILQAAGGTLFLDQIESLSLALQPKLLRVLQTRMVDTPEGAQSVDFRCVTATTAPLREAIRDGRLREDLYYRIAGYELTLPALRQIPGDLALLFEHFLAAAAARHGRDVPEVGFQDRKALQAHHWPGNLHELRLVAERHVLGLEQPRSRPEASELGLGQSLRDLVANFEAQEIARVLDRCRGNTEAAARILGLPRRTLNDKIAKSPLLQHWRDSAR